LKCENCGKYGAKPPDATVNITRTLCEECLDFEVLMDGTGGNAPYEALNGL